MTDISSAFRLLYSAAEALEDNYGLMASIPGGVFESPLI
jgi:hypothetical protein